MPAIAYLRRNRIRTVLSVVLTLFAAPLWAHSFDTMLVVPAGADDNVRADMAVAFLIATEETDGHPNAESDGHLGGLDVYLTVLGAEDVGATAAAPEFIAAPVAPPDAGVPLRTGAVMVGPMAADDARATEYLGRAADPALPPFAERFAARTGRRPGPEAVASYIAARRIGAAVRAAGDASDPNALRAFIAR